MFKRNFFLVMLGFFFAVVAIIFVGTLLTDPVQLPTDHSITEAKMENLIGNRIKFMALGSLINTLDSESFDGEQVIRLVNQDDFYRLVVAYGAHDNGKQCAILYAVNDDGQRLPIIMEVAHPCPPWCDEEETLVSK